MKKLIIVLIAAGVLVFTGNIFAGVLAPAVTINVTSHSAASLYLATNDSEFGTYIGDIGQVPEVSNFFVQLQWDVTNYIHIYASNADEVAGLLGDFTISGYGFQFGNGTEYELTNTSSWICYASEGFGSFKRELTSYGTNGVIPWGTIEGINSAAEWIWGPSTYNSYYLSLPVYPIPEPTTIVLLGFGCLSFIRRK
jgi:hypothetical protein